MLEFKFLPFKNLETERLLLRRPSANDVGEMFLLRSDPGTMKYVPRPLAKTREDALEHLELINSKIEDNTGINWVITLKDDPKFIGIIGHYRLQPENHRAEIGYMLLPEYHGKGIATEAIKAALIYAFDEMKLHSVEAVIDSENIASEMVLLKNGFVKEAHFVENEYWNGKFRDTIIYSLLERNFIP